MSTVSLYQLGAAAADVEDENVVRRMRPTALHAQMDEPRLFLPRNDLDVNAQGAARLFEELILVPGVTKRARRHGPDMIDAFLLERPCHASENGSRQLERFVADPALAEHRIAQPRDLPLLGENANGTTRHDLRRLHPHRVAADVEGAVARHGTR